MSRDVDGGFFVKGEGTPTGWTVTPDGVHVPVRRTSAANDAGTDPTSLAPLVGKISPAERAWTTRGKLHAPDPKRKAPSVGSATSGAFGTAGAAIPRITTISSASNAGQSAVSSKAASIEVSRPIPKFIMPEETHAFDIVYPNAIKTSRRPENEEDHDRIEAELYSAKAVRMRERLRKGLPPDDGDDGSGPKEPPRPKSIFQAEIDKIFQESDDSSDEGEAGGASVRNDNEGEDGESQRHSAGVSSGLAASASMHESNSRETPEPGTTGWFGVEISSRSPSDKSFYTAFKTSPQPSKRPTTATSNGSGVKTSEKIRKLEESVISKQFYRPPSTLARPKTASIPSRSSQVNVDLLVSGSSRTGQIPLASQPEPTTCTVSSQNQLSRTTQLVQQRPATALPGRSLPLTQSVASSRAVSRPEGDIPLLRANKLRPRSAIPSAKAQTHELAKALHAIQLEVRDLRYSTALSARNSQKSPVPDPKALSIEKQVFQNYAHALDPARLPMTLRPRILWPFAIDGGAGAVAPDLSPNPINPAGLSAASILPTDPSLRAQYGPEFGPGSYDDSRLYPRSIQSDCEPSPMEHALVEAGDIDVQNSRPNTTETCLVDHEGYVLLEKKVTDEDGIELIITRRVPYAVLCGRKSHGLTAEGEEITFAQLRVELARKIWKVLPTPVTAKLSDSAHQPQADVADETNVDIIAQYTNEDEHSLLRDLGLSTRDGPTFMGSEPKQNGQNEVSLEDDRLRPLPQDTFETPQLPAGTLAEKLRLERTGDFNQTIGDAKALGMAQAGALTQFKQRGFVNSNQSKLKRTNEGYIDAEQEQAEAIAAEVIKYEQDERLREQERAQKRAERMLELNPHHIADTDESVVGQLIEAGVEYSRTCYGCWREAHGQSAQLDVVTKEDEVLFKHYCDRHRTMMKEREIERTRILERHARRELEEKRQLELQKILLLSSSPHVVKPKIPLPGKAASTAGNSADEPLALQTLLASGTVLGAGNVPVHVLGGEPRLAGPLFTDMTWRTYSDDTVKKAVQSALIPDKIADGSVLGTPSQTTGQHTAFKERPSTARPSSPSKSSRNHHAETMQTLQHIKEIRRSESAARAKARKETDEYIQRYRQESQQALEASLAGAPISAKLVQQLRPRTAFTRSATTEKSTGQERASLSRPFSAIESREAPQAEQKGSKLPAPVTESTNEEESEPRNEKDSDDFVVRDEDDAPDDANDQEFARLAEQPVGTKAAEGATASQNRPKTASVKILTTETKPRPQTAQMVTAKPQGASVFGFKGLAPSGRLLTPIGSPPSINSRPARVLTAVRRGAGGKLSFELLTPEMLAEQQKLALASNANEHGMRPNSQARSSSMLVKGPRPLSIQSSFVPDDVPTVPVETHNPSTTMRSMSALTEGGMNEQKQDAQPPPLVHSQESQRLVLSSTPDSTALVSARSQAQSLGHAVDLTARFADALAGAASPLTPTAAVANATTMSALKDVWIPKTVIKSRPGTAHPRGVQPSDPERLFHPHRIAIRRPVRNGPNHFAPTSTNVEADFEPSMWSHTRTISTISWQQDIDSGADAAAGETISDPAAELSRTADALARQIPQLLDDDLYS